MANEKVVDAEYARRMALASFLASEGFKIFSEELAGQMEYAESCIEEQKKNGFISESGLCKLNYNFGKKDGIQVILNVLEQLKDEIAPDKA